MTTIQEQSVTMSKNETSANLQRLKITRPALSEFERAF